MLALYALVAVCTFQTVRVEAVDMEGRVTSYRAPFWLCEPGTQPKNAGNVRPLCYEAHNPYGRILWAMPWHWEDLRWTCSPD